MNKFKILAVSKLKPANVIVDGRPMPFAREVKVLGLTIKRTGVSKHLTGRSKHRAGKLRRFGSLSPHIQVHLYKSVIRPTMEYPSAIHGILSKTNMKRMQQYQNKMIRKAARRDQENENLTIGDLHAKFKIEAINVRLQKALKKLYEKMWMQYPEFVRQTENLNDDGAPDHYWWRRLSPGAVAEDEEPLYNVS